MCVCVCVCVCLDVYVCVCVCVVGGYAMNVEVCSVLFMVNDIYLSLTD